VNEYISTGRETSAIVIEFIIAGAEVTVEVLAPGAEEAGNSREPVGVNSICLID
jgi:hypothetical protein